MKFVVRVYELCCGPISYLAALGFGQACLSLGFTSVGYAAHRFHFLLLCALARQVNPFGSILLNTNTQLFKLL